MIVATESELAYIAGFFDGEGCITSMLLKSGYSRLRVQITQKDQRPLLFVQKVFGGTFKAERTCTQLGWNGTAALPFLQAVSPYLLLKRDQAVLAIEWISLNGGQYPRGSHLAPEVKARRFEIDAELKRLKRVA